MQDLTAIAQEFVDTFKGTFLHKATVQPVYSLGFERYMKLSQRQRNALNKAYFIKNNFDATGAQDHIKSFLSAMTDEEFIQYNRKRN